MTVVAYFSLDNVHNNHNLKRTSDTNVIGYGTPRDHMLKNFAGTLLRVDDKVGRTGGLRANSRQITSPSMCVSVCVHDPMIFCR